MKQSHRDIDSNLIKSNGEKTSSLLVFQHLQAFRE